MRNDTDKYLNLCDMVYELFEQIFEHINAPLWGLFLDDQEMYVQGISVGALSTHLF